MTDKPSDTQDALRESATERWTISERDVFVFARERLSDGTVSPQRFTWDHSLYERGLRAHEKLYEKGFKTRRDVEPRDCDLRSQADPRRRRQDEVEAMQQAKRPDQYVIAPFDENVAPGWRPAQRGTAPALYVVPLDDHRLIVATDDVYLVQTLRRMDGEPTDRALSSTEIVWDDVDLRSELWGLRLVPELTSIGEKTSYTSVAWSLGEEQETAKNVVLRPRKGADVRSIGIRSCGATAVRLGIRSSTSRRTTIGRFTSASTPTRSPPADSTRCSQSWRCRTWCFSFVSAWTSTGGPDIPVWPGRRTRKSSGRVNPKCCHFGYFRAGYRSIGNALDLAVHAP